MIMFIRSILLLHRSVDFFYIVFHVKLQINKTTVLINLKCFNSV